MKKELTAIGLRRVTKPKRGRVELIDTRARGLCFRVSAKGEHSWSVRLKVFGLDRRFQLGTYPEVSLSEARQACEQLRSDVRAGKDPVKERREAREIVEAQSVSEVLALYDELHLSRSNYRDRRLRMFKRAFGSRLDRPLLDLRRSDLQRAVDALVKQSPISANRLVTELKHFSSWALKRGYLEEDLGAALEKPTKERARDRVLSLEEVGKIWNAAEGLGEPFAGFVRVLMLSGQRRGDVAGMRWAEIEGDQWHIPSARTKNGKPHIVHLSKPVLDLLQDLAPVGSRERRGLVFCHSAGVEIKTFHRAKAHLDKLSGVTGWRLHDLRTAFASHSAEAGIAEGVVDRVLNHVAGGSKVSAVARVYQRSELLKQRAQALERWAELVLRAAGGAEGDNVLRLVT